ncbi:hypothetical protein [Brevibacillus migulae]|uniref:hypothetical protein n=1 Tax=Brevibacillus migulae TaxID=1644114 RepID=UPI00106F0098|nr:hypothetical protein [Brevibacillus migulae]
MGDQRTSLINFMKSHEGKDFDALLQDDLRAEGFHFTTYISKGKVLLGNDSLLISEPQTGRFFCLPLVGIKEIQEESTDTYDHALCVTYENHYSVSIQIFELL